MLVGFPSHLADEDSLYVLSWVEFRAVLQSFAEGLCEELSCVYAFKSTKPSGARGDDGR